jgi:hypothetical protein
LTACSPICGLESWKRFRKSSGRSKTPALHPLSGSSAREALPFYCAPFVT